MRVLRGLLLATLGLGLLAGCSGGEKPEAVEQPPQKRASKVPKAPEPQGAAGAAEFHYDPSGKRDPFLSFVKVLKQESAPSAATPLQRFDVSQLVVSAIVWGTEKPRALVLDPSGKGYIVAEGTPIGKNDGRIIHIGDNAVVVKETYVDFQGKATTKDIEMRLSREKGG